MSLGLRVFKDGTVGTVSFVTSNDIISALFISVAGFCAEHVQKLLRPTAHLSPGTRTAAESAQFLRHAQPERQRQCCPAGCSGGKAQLLPESDRGVEAHPPELLSGKFQVRGVNLTRYKIMYIYD